MTTALLQTTYFGPVQWYQKLFRHDRILIEQHDSYQKQTFRNRCVIATANGVQTLTVPVESDGAKSATGGNGTATGGKCLLRDVRISDHNQWRRVHWNALQSAYSESPFFDYYADDIRPFFERRYEFLIDFNEDIRQKMCELIDICPTVEYTTAYYDAAAATDDQPSAGATAPSVADYRDVIHAKHPQRDDSFEPRPYWQVFQHRHGFLPNLSILDLLFCMGPESIFYL